MGLFIGFLGCNEMGMQPSSCLEPSRFVSIQDRLAFSSLRKMLLRFCAKELQAITWECRSQGRNIEYHPRSRIVAFLLSIITSAALSGEDTEVLVSLGIPAIVLALRKQLAFSSQTTFSSYPPVQVILDEGITRRKGGMLSAKENQNAFSLSGPEAAMMIKLGTRVVRGPDWKWGDQVI